MKEKIREIIVELFDSGMKEDEIFNLFSEVLYQEDFKRFQKELREQEEEE